MSQDISVPFSSEGDRRSIGLAKKVFLRLYGDIVEQLNSAVAHRVEEGDSQAAIAREADMDPAFLSRVLSGQAGSNLRTVAAVLAATKYRFRVEAVACENLAEKAEQKNRSLVLLKWEENRGLVALDDQFSQSSSPVPLILRYTNPTSARPLAVLDLEE